MSLALASNPLRPACGSASGGHEHRVAFYDNETFLAESVAAFAGAALRDGDAAIVVATAMHRTAFESVLRASGVDVTTAVDEGRYLTFDAAECLASFMAGGAPHAERFADMAGAMIERAGDGRRRVVVYGEMVALLLDAGDVSAAIVLEELWNDLGTVHEFELLCAYPMRAFEDSAGAEAFGRICATHSAVIPSEEYSLLDDPNEQERVVARLQQETVALRADVARLHAEQEIVAELAGLDTLTGVDVPAAETWVGRLRRTLGEDRLELDCQPIIPLTGGAAREDLLLRMVTRDGSVVGEDEFLPAAQKFGLRAEIDRWIIARAARLAALGQIVQVHLSAASTLDPRLLGLVEYELRAVRAPAAHVIFELSATALNSGGAAGRTFVKGLHKLGCGLSLADFRTGEGNFEYLQHLPAQSLKIEAGLVRDLPDDPANQHLVRAIVKLARSIGIDTIADGVQDAQTLALLRAYGVDYAQGDFIRHPLCTTVNANAPS